MERNPLLNRSKKELVEYHKFKDLLVNPKFLM
jgi:hypothetical protein